MSEKIIEIKEFSPEIYSLVCKLTRQVAPDRNPPSESEFLDIVHSDNSHLFVIQDDSATSVGMLSTGIYRTPTGNKAWIEDVVIDDAYRGRGFGKKIVEYAIDFLRELNVDTVSLTTNSSRVVANQLYQKLGFVRYETNVYKMRF